jgi:TrpR family transcriptional regulator, trp operon repressor
MKESDGWKPFIDCCNKTNKNNKLDELLSIFLTHEERLAIADRYVIIKDLLDGELSQRELSRQRQVSIAKITRGSNVLKTMDEQTVNWLKKLMA